MVMKRSGMAMAVVVVVVLGLSILVQETQAQCSGQDISKLSACLSASASNVMPSAACCQALAGFQSTSGQTCLCAASTDPRFTSSGAKTQFAVLIPQKCNLKYKAGTVCNGVVIPGGQ